MNRHQDQLRTLPITEYVKHLFPQGEENRNQGIFFYIGLDTHQFTCKKAVPGHDHLVDQKITKLEDIELSLEIVLVYTPTGETVIFERKKPENPNSNFVVV